MPIRRSKRSSVERALAAKAKNGDSICYPHHIFAQTDKGGHGKGERSARGHPERSEGPHAGCWTIQAKPCDPGSWARSLASLGMTFNVASGTLNTRLCL